MNNTINLFVPGESEKRINPLLCRNNVDTWLMGCIYQGMMMYNEKLELIPRLLENYVYNDDKTVHTLRLKNNIYWSDDVQITSNDIRFTLDMILSSERNVFQAEKFKNIFEILIIDSLTLQITLKNPDKFFEQRLLLPIIPKHIFEKVNIDAFYDNNYDYNYVGSGPFKLINTSKDKYMFERNEKFHLGTPKIKNMNIYTGNSQDLENLIERDEIDFFTLSGNEYSEKIAEKMSTKFTVYPLIKPEIIYIVLNHRNELLKDKKNRNAINSLINKESLINSVFDGFAEELNQFYPSILSNFKSNNILKEEVDFENISNSHFNLGYAENNPTHMKIANNIQESLKKKGIDITLKEFSTDSWKSDLNENKLDMYIITHTLMINPDPSFSFGENGIIRSLSGWNDKKSIALMNKGLNIDSKYFRDWSHYLGEEMPVIFICSPYDVQIINNRIQNICPDPRGVLWNIHELMIEE